MSPKTVWPAGVISSANCPSRALAGMSAILVKLDPFEPEARLTSIRSVDDGDGRRRRRAVGVHSRCERPRPARPFTCVPSHACSHCPSKRAALYPIRLHSPLSYACESIHALHPFTMRMAAACACSHSSLFYACESLHARGCPFDPCVLIAFPCMRSDPSPPLI